MPTSQIPASEIVKGDFIQLRGGTFEVVGAIVKDEKAFIKVVRDKAANTFKADELVGVVRRAVKPVVTEEPAKADAVPAPTPSVNVTPVPASAIPDTAPPKSKNA